MDLKLSKKNKNYIDLIYSNEESISMSKIHKLLKSLNKNQEIPIKLIKEHVKTIQEGGGYYKVGNKVYSKEGAKPQIGTVDKNITTTVPTNYVKIQEMNITKNPTWISENKFNLNNATKKERNNEEEAAKAAKAAADKAAVDKAAAEAAADKAAADKAAAGSGSGSGSAASSGASSGTGTGAAVTINDLDSADYKNIKDNLNNMITSNSAIGVILNNILRDVNVAAGTTATTAATSGPPSIKDRMDCIINYFNDQNLLKTFIENYYKIFNDFAGKTGLDSSNTMTIQSGPNEKNLPYFVGTAKDFNDVLFAKLAVGKLDTVKYPNNITVQSINSYKQI